MPIVNMALPSVEYTTIHRVCPSMVPVRFTTPLSCVNMCSDIQVGGITTYRCPHLTNWGALLALDPQKGSVAAPHGGWTLVPICSDHSVHAQLISDISVEQTPSFTERVPRVLWHITSDIISLPRPLASYPLRQTDSTWSAWVESTSTLAARWERVLGGIPWAKHDAQGIARALAGRLRYTPEPREPRESQRESQGDPPCHG